MRVSLELQPCCGSRSGIGVYTYEIAKRLFHTESILFMGNVFNFLNQDDISEVIQNIHYPVRINSAIPYGAYRRLWHLLPFSYQSFFPESDLTHFFNYIVPPKVKGKAITTIYDMSYKFYPDTLDRRNYKRISKDIHSSIDRSDVIITISENSKKEILEEFGIPESQVQIIYPGIDVKIGDYNFQQIPINFDIPSKYILYVGNLEPRKNISTLIKSFALLKKETKMDYHLVIAGQKGWLYENIFKTVEDLKISKHVTFTGYVSSEEKSALYRNASLFVYPSLYEGFGIPILEAMSSGVPVVCSNTSSMPEAAGEAALSINPNEAESITSAMYQMLASEDLRNEKIQLGYRQAEKFSWDKSVKKLIGIYTRLGS